MLINDSFKNLVSGLGTEKDKLAHGRFHHTFLSKPELDALYTSDWLAGKIVDAPCDDMTREWREWKGGPKQIKAIESAEKQFRVRQRVNLALKQARQYGGAAILIGDGSPNPEKPLEAATLPKGGLKFLHVLSRHEIVAGLIDRDPMSLTYGEPSYYEVFSQKHGSARIHPTRVVRFLGQTPLELTTSVEGWGLPVLQRVYAAVRNVAASSTNLASLTHEAKIDVISIPELNKNASNPVYREQVVNRFALANTAKSLQNMLLLDSAEKYEQKRPNFGELPETVRLFLEMAAGAADVPATRLLGTSPKGLNATGANEVRNYYDMLSARQEVELRPGLERLDTVLIRHAIGALPDNVSFEWKPLWQLTADEKSSIALRKAQTTQIYAPLGVASPEAFRKAIQGQVFEDDVYPGFQGYMDEHPDDVAAPLIAVPKPVDQARPNTTVPPTEQGQ